MPTANDAQSAQISLSISQLRALSLLIQEVSQNSKILKRMRVNFVPRSQEIEYQRVQKRIPRGNEENENSIKNVS